MRAQLQGGTRPGAKQQGRDRVLALVPMPAASMAVPHNGRQSGGALLTCNAMMSFDITVSDGKRPYRSAQAVQEE